jgi:hypothetical protein
MAQRQRLSQFETEFAALHKSAVDLLGTFPEDRLFAADGSTSFGFEIIRSAAEVEKTFGGIMTRLWDDPFEWTLPEELSTKIAIESYLNEVQVTRTKGLLFISSDDELSMTIPAPENFRSLSDILTQTVEISTRHLERARAIANSLQPT